MSTAQLPEPEDHQLSEREQRIFDFLAQNPAGVLASADSRGLPHASVIYYAVDRINFTLSFLTKTGTQKYRNLAVNNRMELAVFEAASQTVAQVSGVAREITDPEIIKSVAYKIFQVSKGTNASIPPITKLQAGAFTAFSIIPEQIRIAYYQRAASGNYDQLFESIESFDLKPQA